MNRNKLKTYAPQARRQFIQAVTDRAAFYGLTKDKIEPVTVNGDVAIIAGKPFPAALTEKRKRLEERIERHGFDQVMEAMAYTWFNRLVAIRYMELHGYLDHGYRVLSHPEGKATPEIVEHAERVDLPGLDKENVITLKLDGTKEAELYRILLIAQCNALHTAMPFLFERIADETELLLPDNLLHSDSVIRKLVGEIEEPDWEQVEIIGWLYQFYISEKKDEVIGKVVESEDIPAATQLFTPNWIVKYLVHNSLGRKWLATYPASPLRQKMDFYIEPADQMADVQAHLAAIMPASLNPEELTLIDPACGSGHILVEGYDLLKDIYLERGYRLRDIPKLVLTKNLFGLEIDDRAAQLAAFALVMKARADDRHLFDAAVQPNVLAIQESNGLNVNAIAQAFTEKKLTNEDDALAGEFGFMTTARSPLFATENRATATVDDKLVADLKSLFAVFETAKTYGSLLTIPRSLAERLPDIARAVNVATESKHVAVEHAAGVVSTFLNIANILSRQFDFAIANPPYMGSKYYSPKLKTFVNKEYRDAKADLYACFIQRNAVFVKPNGFVGMITIPNWMFLSSFEEVRKSLFNEQTIDTFLHNGRGVFGSDFGSCSFVIRNAYLSGYRGTFRRLFDKQGSVASNEELERRFGTAKSYTPSNADFAKIPGIPVAYWASQKAIDAFMLFAPITQFGLPRQGLATGDNGRFLRFWPEVSFVRVGFGCDSVSTAHASGKAWFPCNKGGSYRKWFGNNDVVIRFDPESRNILKTLGNHLPSESYYFKAGITWSTLSVGAFSMRLSPVGFIFETKGAMCFPSQLKDTELLLGYSNSRVVEYFLRVLSPTVDYHEGPFGRLPFRRPENTELVSDLVKQAVAIAKADWDSFESSWDFLKHPLLCEPYQTISEAWDQRRRVCDEAIEMLRTTEEAINGLFLEVFGLQNELAVEVSKDEIVLWRPSQTQAAEHLLSYALGCAMGRYSLDKPSLIYANSGNDGFEASLYKTFPADADGIIPITEVDWFDDAAARRFEEFVGVVWPKEHLEENLKFVAESLSPKNSERPRDTIRRYLADDYFKGHLQTYKRRPIYWMFTSGKLGAFQCLVYLHRYNEGTLARMRTEYVIPLQGKISARIDQLAGDKGKATSTAHSKKIEKEQELLKKQQAELLKFDEKLRHYADLRIKLDLDDGVKVNYAKFGDLLAETKAVCGKGEEE